MDDLNAILTAMEQPLAFAAKNNFASLHTVKGLEELIPSLAEKLLAFQPHADLAEKATLLGNSFRTFSGKPRAAQEELIAEALDCVRQAQSAFTTPQVSPAPNTITNAAEQELPVWAADIDIFGLELTSLRGVGPKTAEALQTIGLRTIEDLLYHAPRTYIDRRRMYKIGELSAGMHATVVGSVMTARIGQLGGRMRVFDLLVNDGSGVLSAKWFNVAMPFAQALKKKYTEGQNVLLAGQTTQFKFRIEMHHPEVELVEPDDGPSERLSIVPVYPLTEGISQKSLQKIAGQVINLYAERLPEYLPGSVRARYGLVDIQTAFRGLHAPDSDMAISELEQFTSPCHRRIIFDEFFLLQSVLALRKHGTAIEPGISFSVDGQTLESFIASLPFQLTRAQQRTFDEILADMRKPSPMNRLVQGDVGSGKTVIAVLACLVAHWNGYQSALMAPTEILAGQHYVTMQTLLSGLDIGTVLLTSSMSRAERDKALAAIADGKASIAVGTHALIQEAVEFKNLGLAVIDEQHRFGVMQRGCIKKKGACPDVLVMTATPIPRTLGLTVYGDLDISIINELPPGRAPVATRVYHENKRDDVYRLIRRTLEKGNQAFIVYPLVEESEKSDLKDATTMTVHLQQNVFPEFTIGLVHGKMPQPDKDAVMAAFQTGKLHILVATTVIEVGIDVPNASLMVIEHAERFGLSQLHQLRGRVGRGSAQSACILLAQYKKSDNARQRLAIMEKTTDGFKIAEEDFNIRGPGEFLGTRQSGLTDFRVANIARDVAILTEARTAAFDLIAADPKLEKPEHQLLRLILAARSRGRLELAGIG